MVNEFGKVLRKIRLDNNETMKDMAEKLQVSTTFLCNVEHGYKKVPYKWFLELKNLYNLDNKTYGELENAYMIDNGGGFVKFDTQDEFLVKLFCDFAKNLDKLDNAERNRVRKMLNKVILR